MSLNNTFAINLRLLRQCRKKYTVVFFYFVISSVMLLIYGFLNMLSISPDMYIRKFSEDPENLMSPNYLVLFVDSVVVSPIVLYLGYRISVCQHDLAAILNIMLLTTNLLLFFLNKEWSFFRRVPLTFGVYTLYSAAGIFFSVLGLVTNRKYHWLEEQEGFPNFSEHLAEYDKFGSNWEKYNPYIEQSERLRKTAQDHMDDLPQLSPEQLENLGSAYEKDNK